MKDSSNLSQNAPASLDQRILALLQQNDYVPQNISQLDESLRLTKSERRTLEGTLQKLLDEGSVARIKRDRYVIPRDADLVSGTIRFRQSGAAVLVPDKPGETVLQISAEDTGVALHDDKVLVRLQDQPQWIRRKRESKGLPPEPFARVVRILQRARTTVTGTLKRSRLFYFVIPDDPRMIQDILVPPPAESGLTPEPALDDKVIVRLHEWKQRHLNPEGEIIEILGRTHEPFAEFKALLHKFNLNPEFPEAVMAEVARVPAKVSAEEASDRRDMRNVLTLTIDPDDAKDFDDALSLEDLPDGGTRVGVHIADVSHYVQHGTALDKEARLRGNSTYLVGCVIPMLPHALSNGICSLVEAQDRLTKSTFLEFDAKHRLVRTFFANTVIRSDKRLTYHQAYAFMTKDSLEEIRATPMPPAHQTGSTGRALSEVSDKELLHFQKAIRRLWDIASRMRQARFRKGSLELDMPEVKIFVDEKGYADRMEVIKNDESHQLIEEFMLAANEAVARAFYEARMPTISRVHDNPDPEKLLELRDHLSLAGIRTGDLTEREEVTRMLAKIKEHPQAYTLRLQFLRSLKQACYRAAYDGHYGLAKKFYLHFTSPIRRYSDLIVHRQFDWYASRHGLETAPRHAPKPYSAGDLEASGAHLSITERNSQEAERESVKIKLLEFFEREVEKAVKTEFSAVILDIKNHGMFVELNESMAYGLIHISTLQDDLYRVNEEGTALVGRRSGRRFQLGETIMVVTERVDRFKRQIDFRVSDARHPSAPARKQAGIPSQAPARMPGDKNKKPSPKAPKSQKAGKGGPGKGKSRSRRQNKKRRD